jgi:5-formyltetrahydrofolate cyclo-ligase
MTGDLAAAKREVRRQVLTRRDAAAPELRAAWSEAICRRVSATPEFAEAQTVLLFASFGSEVDTGPLLREALAQGKQLVLPRVDPVSRRLELRRVGDLDGDLAPGTWGIPEPVPERCPEVLLEAADFVLVPGVAFDRNLRRVGYGGGYYDGLLAAAQGHARAVAVAFSLQLVPEAPADDRDLPVPVLITETERIDRP